MCQVSPTHVLTNNLCNVHLNNSSPTQCSRMVSTLPQFQRKFLCAFPIASVCSTCPAHLVIDLIAPLLGEEHISWSFFTRLCYTFCVQVQMFTSTLFSLRSVSTSLQWSPTPTLLPFITNGVRYKVYIPITLTHTIKELLRVSLILAEVLTPASLNDSRSTA